MATRDYFDFPDDEKDNDAMAPEPVKPVLMPHTSDEAPLEFNYPKSGRRVGRTIIAVLVFLIVLGGCGFMVLHQIHNDLKPKPKTQTSVPAQK